MLVFKCEANPAFSSPLPTFPPLFCAPATSIFFSSGVSAVFSKVWIKVETGRVKRWNREKCLTPGGWWHRMWEWREWWLPCLVPTTEDTVRTNHQKWQLSQEIFWIKTPLQNKGKISLLPVLCDSSAATPDTYPIQTNSGSAEWKYYRSVVLNA